MLGGARLRFGNPRVQSGDARLKMPRARSIAFQIFTSLAGPNFGFTSNARINLLLNQSSTTIVQRFHVSTYPLTMPAFIHTVSLRSSFRRPLAHSYHRHACHSRTTPTMVSATSIATELIAFTGLATATYFFLFRENSGNAETETDTETLTPKAPLLGLTMPEAAPTASAPSSPPADLKINSVGVNIEDYLDAADSADSFSMKSHQQRLEEELQFATDSLQDADLCEGMLVVDADGDVIWCEGPLIGDTSELDLQFIMNARDLNAINVSGNQRVPFLKQDVRSVAYAKVGSKGAILILASSSNAFLGDRDKRVLNAVSNRLAPFVDLRPNSRPS